MVKEIKEMTDKELKEEWQGIESHIRNFAYGKSELYYREDLEREADKRGLLI